MLIFDCNGVLVDGEEIAAAVAEEEFARAGVEVPAEIISQLFAGRRASDMIAAVEAATHHKLPVTFPTHLTSATLRRFRLELRATPHAAYALTWLRGPKCVASSATAERIRVSLEVAELLRFFDANIFSGNDVAHGKPAPDLFLHAAACMQVRPSDCIVVEDSPVGIQAAVAAGMKAIGFAGGRHAEPQLPAMLTAAGARTVIPDLRALKSAVVALRGW